MCYAEWGYLWPCGGNRSLFWQKREPRGGLLTGVNEGKAPLLLDVLSEPFSAGPRVESALLP